MSHVSKDYPTLEAAIMALPENFWIYVGGSNGNGSEWEPSGRYDLLAICQDDDECNLEDGLEARLDKPVTAFWLDPENCSIGNNNDPGMYIVNLSAHRPANVL